MPSYDLHTHSKLTIGENTVEEMSSMANKLGFSGIGIVRYSNNIIDLPNVEVSPHISGKVSEILNSQKLENIDIISCVEIQTKNVEELDKEIKRVRNKSEIVIVSGGDYDINRAACENSMVDILAHPELDRKDSGLDYVCIRSAKENNVAIELHFKSFLESFKRKRTNILNKMGKNVKLCNKYNAKIIVSSGAITKWGMRSGREMSALAKILGMELGQAISTTTSVPEEMVKKNREKLSGKRIEGVREINGT